MVMFVKRYFPGQGQKVIQKSFSLFSKNIKILTTADV